LKILNEFSETPIVSSDKYLEITLMFSAILQPPKPLAVVPAKLPFGIRDLGAALGTNEFFFCGG
jgi:hypothetical protein